MKLTLREGTLCCIIILLIITIIIICTGVKGNDEVKEPIQPSSLTFETVAHIDPASYPDYELVWSDTKTDRAVYIKKDYVPKPVCKIGDTVSFNGLVCNVISVDEQGIEISLPDNVTVAYGMSGSVVTLKGIPVAVISRATSLITAYAVYL